MKSRNIQNFLKKITQKASKTGSALFLYFKNRRWNLEFLVAFATLIYTIVDNQQKDEENRIEIARIRSRDSAQISVLIDSYKDSKLKEEENREELRRIRWRDSIQLAIQIEKNVLERQEFIRMRKRDSLEYATLKNSINNQKIANGPNLRYEFGKALGHRTQKEQVPNPFYYQFSVLNFGKSYMSNIKVSCYLVFESYNEYKSLQFTTNISTKNHVWLFPTERSQDVLMPNEGVEIACASAKNFSIILNGSNRIEFLKNDVRFPLSKEHIYIVTLISYNDIFGEDQKDYRVLWFIPNKNATVYNSALFIYKSNVVNKSSKNNILKPILKQEFI